MHTPSLHPTGFAGRLAQAFVNSKLTPLGIIASLLLGILAIVLLPREEEPQIKVPMIDVMVSMPGATPKEVEERMTIPMEKLLYELPVSAAGGWHQSVCRHADPRDGNGVPRAVHAGRIGRNQ